MAIGDFLDKAKKASQSALSSAKDTKEIYTKKIQLVDNMITKIQGNEKLDLESIQTSLLEIIELTGNRDRSVEDIKQSFKKADKPAELEENTVTEPSESVEETQK